MLLIGWLASRLDWRPTRSIRRGDALSGKAHAERLEIALRLEAAPELQVRGLEG
jgi:glucose-6-phosphate dehydrogenase assembly protein OpcA